MTTPTTSAGPKFACPECGDTRIGEWRNEVAIYDVVAWNEDGAAARRGEELDRLDEGPVTGPKRYTCFCGADFGKPVRVTKEVAHA
jgi:hypothetical protein